MVKGKKAIKRRIVYIWASPTLTQRGNPDHYWMILECGHTKFYFHGPFIVVRYYLLETLREQGIEERPMIRCEQCEANASVDVEFLKKITPWWVWEENNFDRFLEESGKEG